jgi:hypothetical protein
MERIGVGFLCLLHTPKTMSGTSLIEGAAPEASASALRRSRKFQLNFTSLW